MGYMKIDMMYMMKNKLYQQTPKQVCTHEEHEEINYFIQ